MCNKRPTSAAFRLGALRSSHPLPIVTLTYLLSFTAAASTSSNNNTDFQTLLCLKLHLGNPASHLSSWAQQNSLHFCSWPGVTCSNTNSSRIVALDLEEFGLEGQIPPCIANLTLLSRIHFPGNLLSGQIPKELDQLSRLSYLNLSSNSLGGSIPNNLSSTLLQVIDLSSNKLGGDIPEVLGMLRNLSVLHLAGNSLTGHIPLSLGSSSSLVSVILSNNSLTGTIPSALANSSSLQELDLVRNNLGGDIPPALFNSTSLRRLILGRNNFGGFIPAISNINSPLQDLYLSVNGLAGAIPSSLGNFSSLRRLNLAANNFEGSIPVSIGKISNLKELDISYNNRLSGTVPASLYNMSSLTYLSLAVNNFSGGIPSDIGYTLPSIQTLILQENHFQGQIPASLGNATSFQYINLAANAFHGIIPSFGSLPNLNVLKLKRNQLEAGDWSFLSSLGNCTQLQDLTLGKNMLHGNLPSSVGSLANTLQSLVLYANKISGSIPPEIGNLTNLSYLSMEQNHFVGSVPGEIGNLANLTFLDLSENKLSGHIPLSIGKLRQLNNLFLQENNFSGPIPRTLGECKNLIALNLSYNTLNESLPKELFSLSSLSACLDLSHNQLSGQIPQEIGGLINIGLLKFSNNHLSGQIPITLGACVLLESLHMEGNILDGRIPESLANLRGISEIDLSRNNLSGEIPMFFQSFNSLKLLNLSFNNFDGQIPEGGIFQNASEVFVEGNIMLCSTSSSTILQLPLCFASSRHSHTSRNLGIIGSTMALALVTLSCTLYILLKRSKISKQSDYPKLREMKNFSYADLVRATNCFSSDNLLGSGTYGTVYKGVHESEAQEIAIKVFKLDQIGAPRSFLAECEAFRNTRHRNLVRVISTCSTWDYKGNDFKALIIEYMANGTLETWLYSKMRRPLSLSSRAKIAVDIASALEYLHNHCMPPIVHCDLKPSNVLLDDVMGARLSDFGLAKFLQSSSSNASSTSLTGPRGSIGYIAPEYGFGSKISTEGDVYSYGIIILEMLTGKRPTDEFFNNGLSLHKFVKNAFPQKIGEILDANINPNFGDNGIGNYLDKQNHIQLKILSCITQLVKLGLSCSMEAPRDRPTMCDVYGEVFLINQALSSLCIDK